MRGRLARGYKITLAELIANGNDGRSHGPVFMGSARPSQALFRINPNGETHATFPYGLFANKTCATTGLWPDWTLRGD